MHFFQFCVQSKPGKQQQQKKPKTHNNCSNPMYPVLFFTLIIVTCQNQRFQLQSDLTVTYCLKGLIS